MQVTSRRSGSRSLWLAWPLGADRRRGQQFASVALRVEAGQPLAQRCRTGVDADAKAAALRIDEDSLTFGEPGCACYGDRYAQGKTVAPALKNARRD
jgi:hypothetical protein